MKKLMLIILSILFLLVYSGCSAQQRQVPLSIYDQLTFDYGEMSYTLTSPSDILYRTGNPFDDFVILHQKTLQKSLTSEEFLIYQRLFSLILLGIDDTSLTFADALTYSSSELRTLWQEKSISYTLDDIVAFNNLKILIEDMKSSPLTSTITKISYIEYYLDIELTDLDLSNLEVFQEYISIIFDPFSSYLPADKELSSLLEALEFRGVELSEDDLTAITQAYQLIEPLFNP